MGGDEFVAFVLADSPDAISSLGQTIEAGMATFNVTHSYPFDLSISYGGVFITIDKNTFEDLTQLLVHADEQLYEMKKHRRSSRRGIR